jgi:hypothetical protein
MKHATLKREKGAVGNFSLLRMFSVYGGKVPTALPEPGGAVGAPKKPDKAIKKESGARMN